MKKTKQANKIFTKENETDLKDTINKLRARNKQLEKQNKRIKAEYKSLENDFKKTAKYIKGQLADVSLEDVLTAVNEQKSLKSATKTSVVCPDCKNGQIKSSIIPNVGKMEVCSNCNYTKITKDESKDKDS